MNSQLILAHGLLVLALTIHLAIATLIKMREQYAKIWTTDGYHRQVNHSRHGQQAIEDKKRGVDIICRSLPLALHYLL